MSYSIEEIVLTLLDVVHFHPKTWREKLRAILLRADARYPALVYMRNKVGSRVLDLTSDIRPPRKVHDEWTVPVIGPDGKRDDAKTYFTSDEEDARLTYMDMLAREFRTALEGQMV